MQVDLHTKHQVNISNIWRKNSEKGMQEGLKDGKFNCYMAPYRGHKNWTVHIGYKYDLTFWAMWQVEQTTNNLHMVNIFGKIL